MTNQDANDELSDLLGGIKFLDSVQTCRDLPTSPPKKALCSVKQCGATFVFKTGTWEKVTESNPIRDLLDGPLEDRTASGCLKDCPALQLVGKLAWGP